MPNASQVGGEVHFTRLNSGAWIVDRWFIRMPQVIVTPQSLEPRRQLFEEGGTVITDGVTSSTRPATVTGIVRDSAGRPVSGAVVRAIGTHRQVLTGENGAFTLDSLPPGGLSVVVHTEGYDSFAVLAASRRLDLQPGRAAAHRPCGRRIRTTSGAKYVPIPTSGTSSGPAVAVRCACSWWTARRRSRCRVSGSSSRGPRRQTQDAGSQGPERYAQAVTDSRGAATFCDLPLGFPVEVSLAGPTGARAHVMMVELKRTGITGRVVMGRLNR